MDILKIPEEKYYCSDIVIRYINNYHLREYLDQFIKFLLDNYDDEDLSNFFHNISNLKIKNKKTSFITGMWRCYDGCYEACSNTIYIYDNEVLFHELLHMASNNYQKESKIVYQGFSQANLNKKNERIIGTSLNEGYTELLYKRYFNGKHDSAYNYELFVAYIIERIIGPLTMEKLYLNADLYGLVEKLKEYASSEEIIKFLDNFDKILGYEYSNRKYYQEIKKEIYYFLYKTFLIKVRKSLENKKISKDEAIRKITTFVLLYNEKYPIKNEKDLNESYNDVQKTYTKVML